MELKIRKGIYLLIGLIFILISFVRLWQLDSIPSTLNPDEASYAYNALLLSQTGHDEWGESWPLVMDAFGDQKVIGYALLLVPLLKLIDPTDFWVRLPSALAGIGVVFLGGLITWRWKKSPLLTVFSMLIVGIQPVFIWYSRMAFEANITLLYTMLFILLILIKVSSMGQVYLQSFLAGLFVVLMSFTYNSPLILVPLLLLILPFWHGRAAWKKWLPVLAVGITTWVFCVSFSMSLAEQKSQITVFNDPTIRALYPEYRSSFVGVSTKLIGNQYAYYSKIVLNNYLKSLDPGFIVNNSGGHPWHVLPETGYLSFWVYWLGWVGLAIMTVGVFRKRHNLTKSKDELIFVYILMISIVPSAVTVNAPHATRSLLFFVCWSIAASIAIKWLVGLPQSKHQKTVLTLLIGFLILTPALSYSDQLFREYPINKNLQAPLKPGLGEIVQRIDEQGGEVKILDGRGFDYILVAWYLKMDPEVFYSTIERSEPDIINFKYGERVGEYYFVRNKLNKSEISPLVYWDDGEKNWVVEELAD